jgi:UDP-N-acetylglucosamine:LPS N-acetylglucosamine transferase
MTTDGGRRREVGADRLYVVKDASKSDKLAVAWCALQTLRVLVSVRPDVVVSTGAAPGYLAIRLAKAFGARTIWLDSVANVEMLSLSGRMASTRVDLCLTQWPHLASGSIQYLGAVL